MKRLVVNLDESRIETIQITLGFLSCALWLMSPSSPSSLSLFAWVPHHLCECFLLQEVRATTMAITLLLLPSGQAASSMDVTMLPPLSSSSGVPCWVPGGPKLARTSTRCSPLTTRRRREGLERSSNQECTPPPFLPLLNVHLETSHVCHAIVLVMRLLWGPHIIEWVIWEFFYWATKILLHAT